MEQAYTYRKDIRYIQWNNHGYCREKAFVGFIEFYWTWLINFWRVEKFKNLNVIVIRYK